MCISLQMSLYGHFGRNCNVQSAIYCQLCTEQAPNLSIFEFRFHCICCVILKFIFIIFNFFQFFYSGFWIKFSIFRFRRRLKKFVSYVIYFKVYYKWFDGLLVEKIHSLELADSSLNPTRYFFKNYLLAFLHIFLGYSYFFP